MIPAFYLNNVVSPKSVVNLLHLHNLDLLETWLNQACLKFSELLNVLANLVCLNLKPDVGIAFEHLN